MNSANTMPTPAIPAKRALSSEVQRMNRSGCDGPRGDAFTALNGWFGGKSSFPEESSSQAQSRAK